MTHGYSAGGIFFVEEMVLWIDVVESVVGSEIESRRVHTIAVLAFAKPKISPICLRTSAKAPTKFSLLIATPSRNHGASFLLEDLQGPSSSIRVSSSVRTIIPTTEHELASA